MKENFLEFYNNAIPWLITHGTRILLIIILAWLIRRFACRFITKAVRTAVKRQKYTSEISEQLRENTLIEIINTTLSIVILTIAALMIMTEVGLKIGPLLAAAGIVGLAFGFGGQYLIRDVITGLFIIIENQYRIGDVVTLDGTSGSVERITLRMTTLRDMDGTVHHIPNGEIKKVSNMSKDYARVNLNIDISYYSNIELVADVVNRTGRELASDPLWKDAIITPPKFLRVDNLSDSSVVIKVLGDTLPLKQWDVTGELRKRLLAAFRASGIEMQLPQLVVHMPGQN